MKRTDEMNRNRLSGVLRLLSLAADSVLTIAAAGCFIIFLSCVCMNIKERMTGEMAFAFGYKPLYIESGSMEPVIRTGALVLLKEADYSEIEEGDIITFETAGGYVTHRLLGVDGAAAAKGAEACLITGGDANPIVDPERLAPAMIKGKITGILNPL